MDEEDVFVVDLDRVAQCLKDAAFIVAVIVGYFLVSLI